MNSTGSSCKSKVVPEMGSRVTNGMTVLMIGTDRRLFEKDSDVRIRHIGYGELVRELHIIVYSTVNLGYKTESIAKNVILHPTNSRSRWRYISDAARLGKKIGKRIESVELVTSQDASECGLAGLNIARHLKVPLQIQVHTDILSPYYIKHSVLNRIRYIIARYTLRRADCIRVVSQRIYDSLRVLGISNFESKTTILPIFVDTAKLAESVPKFDLRKKYSQFKKILLVLGRLEPEKNVGLAIDTMKKIVKKFPKAGLIIVGDGRERMALGEEAELIKENVIFEGRREDKISYYKGSDLLLVTSDYEGYGMTIVEALATGLPVVSLDVGVAREAGATVVAEKETVSVLEKLLSRPKQDASLGNYSYNSEEDYRNAITDDWKKCLKTD